MSKRKPLYSTVRASPPTTASCSSTTHPTPKFDSSYAAVNPAGPAPRITTRIALSPVFNLLLAAWTPRLAPLQTHYVSELLTLVDGRPTICHRYVKKRSSGPQSERPADSAGNERATPGGGTRRSHCCTGSHIGRFHRRRRARTGTGQD